MTADDKKGTLERVHFADSIQKLTDVDFAIEV
jgi:3-hydroxyacyl-CoA dehydrogenase